jgi:serine/threonine protein kinase/WD40 repeat protein
MSPSDPASLEGLERVAAFDHVAESFLERVRRGERPSLAEYAARYPDMANQIRDLLPMLFEMELAKAAGAVTGAYLPDTKSAVEIPRQLGNYHILRRIGEGGMGVVYEAIQEGLGRHVALKVIRPEFLSDPGFLDRFRREAQAAAQLHHPHIVPVFDAGAHEGIPYFAMQYISGESLAAILEEVKRIRGRSAGDLAQNQATGPLPSPARSPDATVSQIAGRLLSGPVDVATPVHADSESTASAPRLQNRAVAPARPEDSGPSVTSLGDSSEYFRVIARLIAQAASALAFAHDRGILHRDVKPANLLLALDGHVWVGDFGLAKIVEGSDLSRSQDLAGTPRFMAPERFDGWSDRRSDVYALGVTLYEMATLSPAFAARDRAQLIRQILDDEPTRPRRLDRRIPHDLETIIRKAMAREPAERYRSAGDLADDLNRFLTHRPIKARRHSLHGRLWKWCRRKPALAALWLVLMLGLACTLWQWRRAEQSLRQANRMALGLALDRALSFCEKGEPARGMLHMVDLLHTAPSAAPEYDHAIRANLTAWAQKLPRPVAMRRITTDSPHGGSHTHPDLVLTKHVALISRDDGVQVWDLERLERKRVLPIPGGRAAALALANDGRRAVTVASDGNVDSWDVETGAPIGPRITWHGSAVPPGERGFPNRTYLSRDGSLMARCVGVRAVQLRDLRAGAPTGAVLQLSSPLQCAAFSPDGNAFATIGTDYELWETSTGKRLVLRSFPQEKSTVRTMAFSPDGKTLATGSNYGSAQARLWNVSTGLPVGELSHHSTYVSSICYSTDGHLLGLLCSGGRVLLWNATTFAPLCEPFWQYGTDSEFTGTVATGVTWLNPSYVPRTTMAFADGGKCCFTIDRTDTEPYIVKWAVPQKLAGDVLQGRDLSVQPVSVRTFYDVVTVRGENDGNVTFGNGFRLLVTGPPRRGGRQNGVAAEGRTRLHSDSVLAVAVSPDGNILATGSADTTAQLWDLGPLTNVQLSGLPFQRIGRPLAHQGPVRSVAFREDGRVLATGSDDGSARLWDIATGVEIGPHLPHSGPVQVVAFDQDQSLLTKAADGLVRRWALPQHAEGDPDSVLFWIQALTGAELNSEGFVSEIDSWPPDRAAIRRAILALREKGVPPAP